MIRKLKTTGLAVAAVLAMSAVVTSAASATNLTSAKGNYPVSLHAGETTTHEFVVNGRTIKCATATFTGTLTGPTAEQSVTPSYGNCHTIVFGATWPVTFTISDCRYKFRFGIGQLVVDCPIGKNIDIHIYSSAANHAAGTSVCTYHIGSQGAAGLIWSLWPPGVRLGVSLKPTLKRTSGSSITCGAESQTAEYTGESQMTGTFNGGPEGLHIK